MGLVLSRRDIPKCHENGIAGVVVSLIKLLQLIVAEIRYVLWITATVVVIGVVEKFTRKRLPKGTVYRAHGALHLVKHNPFVHQWRVGVSRLRQFNAVSFLCKIQRIEVRKKDGI